MELKIGKSAAAAPAAAARHATARAGWWAGQATAPATIAVPATPAHLACALDAKCGVCSHLWEQHGSAGKRASIDEQQTPREGHVHVQRAAHSAQHTARARAHAGTDWFNHAARVLVWPSVQYVHVRSECQLVWQCPPALEARRGLGSCPNATKIGALCSSTLPDRHRLTSYRSLYIVACLNRRRQRRPP
jgi:hypothetical protein